MGSNPLIRKDGDYTINEDFPLKAPQNEGVEFILKKFNVLLNHQTGLGKTYTSLTASQHILNQLDNIKVLIFCPKKANTSFEKELNEKIKQDYAMYTAEKKIENKEADYIIFNHTTMHKYMNYVRKLSENYNILAIVDEAHILQTNKTRQAKVLIKLRKYFNSVVGLTATPILNKKEGLYHIIDFIKPGFFGTYTSFEKKFLKYKLKKIKKNGKTIRFKDVYDFKNKDKLKKYLGKLVHIRKKKYNLKFYYRKVDMDKNLFKEYVKAGKGIIEEDGVKDWGARLHDLQRVVDNVHDNITSVNLSNKEKLLLKTVKEKVNKGEGTLIYVEYKDTEKRLMDLFDKYSDDINYNNLYRITGSVGQKQRDYIEENIDAKDVVIINEAGSESVDLGEVNNVIFYDIPFAIGLLIQVCGRITRMNTEYDNQNVYLLEVKDTIDTYKRLLIQNNTRIIKSIFGDNSNFPDKVRYIDKRFMKNLRKKLLWKFREWSKV